MKNQRDRVRFIRCMVILVAWNYNSPWIFPEFIVVKLRYCLDNTVYFFSSFLCNTLWTNGSRVSLMSLILLTSEGGPGIHKFMSCE